MLAEFNPGVRVKTRRTSRTSWLSDLFRCGAGAATLGWICADISPGVPPGVCALAWVAQVAMATANIAPSILLALFVFILPPLPVCQELLFEPHAANGEEAVSRAAASRRVFDRLVRL